MRPHQKHFCGLVRAKHCRFQKTPLVSVKTTKYWCSTFNCSWFWRQCWVMRFTVLSQSLGLFFSEETQSRHCNNTITRHCNNTITRGNIRLQPRYTVLATHWTVELILSCILLPLFLIVVYFKWFKIAGKSAKCWRRWSSDAWLKRNVAAPLTRKQTWIVKMSLFLFCWLFSLIYTVSLFLLFVASWPQLVLPWLLH